MKHFPQGIKVAVLHDPNAAPTGDGNAINVGTAQDIFVVVNADVEGSGALEIHPERGNAAEGFVALANNANIWVCANTAATDALVRQNDGTSFNTAAAAVNVMVVMRINPDSLGNHTAGDNLPCDRFRVRLVQGNASDVASVVAYLVPRYQQESVPEVRV